MAVTRALKRIRGGLQTVFESRMAPDDQIEFDASLGLVQVHADEDDEDGDGDGKCETHPVVNIWATLRCPEKGTHAQSTAVLTVGIYSIEEPHEVEEIGNAMWDSLSSNRTFFMLDLAEESRTEDDEIEEIEEGP